MELGLAHFLTDYGMEPVELARAVEERGFESLLLPEHTHIPVSRDTPHPSGAELPPEYRHTQDPFTALAAMAAAAEGARCTVSATLREVVEERKLRFDVEVREGERTIGVGTHERRVVERGA